MESELQKAKKDIILRRKFHLVESGPDTHIEFSYIVARLVSLEVNMIRRI